MTDLVGAVARAIDAATLAWKAANGGDDASCLDVPEDVIARAAIAAHEAALRDAGLVIVPRDTSGTMLPAMIEAFDGVTDAEMVRNIWEAGIAAALGETPATPASPDETEGTPDDR